jgi:hypothetical protein
LEIEESPGYGSLCSTNNDCQHTTIQLECLSGTCVCLEGYVPLGKYLCYNIRGQGKIFSRILQYFLRNIYIKVRQLLKVLQL